MHQSAILSNTHPSRLIANNPRPNHRVPPIELWQRDVPLIDRGLGVIGPSVLIT